MLPDVLEHARMLKISVGKFSLGVAVVYDSRSMSLQQHHNCIHLLLLLLLWAVRPLTLMM
jgi:hypothetical protein